MRGEAISGNNVTILSLTYDFSLKLINLTTKIITPSSPISRRNIPIYQLGLSQITW